mmetsp:Transcript_158033/g.506886  ORF Transcript_158033/g.506886 Transcript_158033/m.506886 type:complete len:331 (+) Transcript_158033:2522-3514(+)
MVSTSSRKSPEMRMPAISGLCAILWKSKLTCSGLISTNRCRAAPRRASSTCGSVMPISEQPRRLLKTAQGSNAAGLLANASRISARRRSLLNFARCAPDAHWLKIWTASAKLPSCEEASAGLADRSSDSRGPHSVSTAPALREAKSRSCTGVGAVGDAASSTARTSASAASTSRSPSSAPPPPTSARHRASQLASPRRTAGAEKATAMAPSRPSACWLSTKMPSSTTHRSNFSSSAPPAGPRRVATASREASTSRMMASRAGAWSGRGTLKQTGSKVALSKSQWLTKPRPSKAPRGSAKAMGPASASSAASAKVARVWPTTPPRMPATCQ